MARIRSVHPGQWSDESFVSVSAFARLLALAVRNEADDNGIFEWKPTGLKMRLFPADNLDMPALLAELVGADIIKSFTHGGRQYGAIRNFRRYQRPKKPKTIHFTPPEFRTYLGLDASSSELDDDDDSFVPPNEEMIPQRDEVGGKREEVKKTPSGSGARLPPDWALPDAWRAWTEREILPNGGDLAALAPWIDRTALKFRDHWLSKAGANGSKRDWQAAWRNWVRRDLDDGRGPVLSPATAPAQPSSLPPEKRYRPATLEELELARRLKKFVGENVTDAQVAEWRKLDQARAA